MPPVCNSTCLGMGDYSVNIGKEDRKFGVERPQATLEQIMEVTARSI